MSKLGDLIVRLFLDKKDYEKGLDASKKKTDSFGTSVKKAWGAIALKITAAAGAVAGMIKIQDKLAHTTQALGDAWDRNVAGMKESWDTFLNAVATGDFSGLIGRMGAAYEAAAALAKAEDAIGEAQTANALSAAQHLEENISLMETARNSMVDGYERIAAITKLQQNIEEENKGLIKSFGDAGEAAIDLFLVKSKTVLSENDITDELRSQVVDFLIWMGNQGDHYAEASVILETEQQIKSLEKTIARLSAQRIDTSAQWEEMNRLTEKVAELRKEYEDTGGDVSKLNMLEGYNYGIKDKLRKKIEEYIPAAKRQESAVRLQTLRFTTLRNSILGSAKSLDVFNKMLGALPESIQEKLKIQGAKDYAGEIDAEIKAILDKQTELENGGNNNNNNGGGGSRSSKYAKSLRDMREKYEQYERWSKSTNESIRKDAEKLYAEISKYGGSYYEYLLEERKKFLSKSKLSKADKDSIALLNDEIIKASPFKDVKWDDVKLTKFTDDVNDLTDALEDLSAIEIDDPLPDPHGMFDTLEEWEKWAKECADTAKELSDDFNNAITSGFSAGIEKLMNGLMGVEELNAGAIFQALLTPLADSVIKAGEMIMAQGIATEAFKKSLASLNGYAAIAAGAALIAAGAAAKAGLAAIAKAGSSTAVSSASTSATASGETQKIRSEITIYVSGKLSGSDIVISGQKTLNSWGR